MITEKTVAAQGFAGSVIGVISALTLNDVGVIVGILTALVTATVTATYYIHKIRSEHAQRRAALRNERRAIEEHELRMEVLRQELQEHKHE